MARGKLILICQSSGDFVTNDDGTLSYVGGEANAVNVNTETLFDDLKLKLAEMCNLDYDTMSIKYFLPGNKRNLITLKNDKDLKRMIDFHGNSITTDVFVMGNQGFNHDTLSRHASRETGIKIAETVNHVVVPTTGTDLTPVNRIKQKHVAKRKTAKHVTKRKIVVPTDATPSPDNSVVSVDATAKSPSRSTNTSTPSAEHAADYDSDYVPNSGAAAVSIPHSTTEPDLTATPADTVKKRRRTASWKIGANGPTIVAVADDVGERRSRKKSSSQSHTAELKRDIILRKAYFDNPYPISSYDAPLDKAVASWSDGITGVGQEFKSVQEFRDTLQKYAIAHRFVYKLKKNDTNRASGICIVDGCSWRIHASWVPSAQSFQIKKLDNTHTCGGESWKSGHPARSWLVSIIKDMLRDSPHQKTKDIANGISRDFGVELSYTQVWRAIEDAREQLQGSYKEAYNQLPWFCEKIAEANPGSLTKFITSDDKRLRGLFVSFQATICGFLDGCRPLLFLEASYLRSKYQEILLTATAVDGNDGFFPVAFAVVDVENDDNWHWFLEQLKSAMSTSKSITFVSDREKNLKKFVLKVFENAEYGYSMYHLMESFKKNLKGPFHGDGKAALPGNLLAAAYAFRLNSFKKCTEQIKQISSQAYDWVMQIEPEYWTSLLFKGEQYNHITQNVAESYITLMEELRESPIMQKMEALIRMMTRLMDNGRVESSKWSTKLTPSYEQKLQHETFKASGLKVLFSSDTLFEVRDDCTHVVNLNSLDCTCLGWKKTWLPCCHAVAVFNSTGRNPYDYCSIYFTVDSFRSTYSKTINSIPGGKPVEDEDADSTVHVLPPVPTRSPSQEKKELKEAESANKRTVTCTRCKEAGHNKKSCKATL